MEYVLGMDIGSSAIKLGLFSIDGAAIALSTRAQDTYEPAPGHKEQDPAAWWRAAAAGIREVCAAVSPRSIAAVAVTGHISSLTFVDKAGVPLRPAIGFQDLRAVAEIQDVQEAFDRAELAARLGIDLPPAATWPLPRLVWFRKHEPRTLDRAHLVLQAKDYVNFKLTGAMASDASSNRGLIDLATNTTPRAVFARLGLPEAIIPPVYGPACVIGRVSPAAANETGLPAGIPVAAGWNDLNASVLGSGAVAPGSAFNISGTSEHIGAVVERDYAAPELVCAPFLRGRKLLYGVTSCGGGSLDWYSKAFGREIGEMLRAAAAAPPGCDGLIFLPYLQGERAPIWDPFAAGAFAGIRASQNEGHFVRAILEGVAFSLRHILDFVGQHVPCGDGPLIVSGGAARVALWNSIKADILARPVVTPANPHAGVLGAAMLAATAVGRYSSPDEAARAMVRHSAAIEPDPGSRTVYRNAFARYRELYPALREWFAGNRPESIHAHA